MLILVTAGLFALPVQAAQELDFLPNTDTFQFNTQDRFYQTPEYSRNLDIKGLEISEGIYFRQLMISEKGGPGFVIEKEDYSLGLTQRGLELLFKF